MCIFVYRNSVVVVAKAITLRGNSTIRNYYIAFPCTSLHLHFEIFGNSVFLLRALLLLLPLQFNFCQICPLLMQYVIVPCKVRSSII